MAYANKEKERAWLQRPEVIARRKANRNKSYQKNKEKYLYRTEKRFAKAKSAAKSRHIPFEITLEEYTEIIQPGTCHYCGGELNRQGSGLDRKDNERVYRKDSVVPCCGRCNLVFRDLFCYEEKMMLADTLKKIDANRAYINKGSPDVHTTSGPPLLN